MRRPLSYGMAAGLGVGALAMAALTVATSARSVTGLVVAVSGLGLSWAAVTSTSAATLALPEHRQGVASGAVNTAAQIGTALGVAVLLAVAGTAGVEGTSSGYAVAFLVAAVITATYSILLLTRGTDRPRTTSELRDPTHPVDESLREGVASFMASSPAWQDVLRDGFGLRTRAWLPKPLSQVPG